MANAAMEQALGMLSEERVRLDQAIRLLQGGEVSQVSRPRRGRPPKAAAQKAAQKTKKRRGRPPMTAAEKKAASERMKKYWAERRKAKGGKAAKKAGSGRKRKAG